ncbi:MAG: TetR family transcriptional regulator [Caulobacterales bacterium]|nr:TetR family transcriptional regulator [Caulobacterales bacterium]
MDDANPTPWTRKRKPRDTQYKDKREAVLERAAALFADKGYGSVSLSELAESLNITKPTLYYYFSSKDDLLLEIQRRAQDAVIEGLQEAERLKGTGRERLELFLKQYIAVTSSNDCRCLITVSSRDLTPKSRNKIQVRARDVEARIQAFIEEGIDDGSFRAQDIRIAYQAMIGMLNSIAVWYKDRGPIKREEMTQQIIQLIFQGL